ncbi:MAG: diguanylate cyclase domain-containing protein [Terracidiphilus sp.]|jgi:diguanylate cyclase (GGDEF)-like protein/PAS domain S-box-containing protein
MIDRTEFLEAALDSIPEGIMLLGEKGEVVFLNTAAETITGHARVELVGRAVPVTLNALLDRPAPQEDSNSGSGPQTGRGCLVHIPHKLGHDVPSMARTLLLRDGLGGSIGRAVVFHSAESLETLPHGEMGEDNSVRASQADLKDLLEALFDDFAHEGPAFGLLWITVDQAEGLRKTHGAGTCESMIEKVERALGHGLRPAEKLGRWGEDEFLVISHERTPEMLAAHAQSLAGLARTTDFRWWGDRVSITVSIGAAQANHDEALKRLLLRAQEAMFSSIHAGGNHITLAPGGQACLPS